MVSQKSVSNQGYEALSFYLLVSVFMHQEHALYVICNIFFLNIPIFQTQYKFEYKLDLQPSKCILSTSVSLLCDVA